MVIKNSYSFLAKIKLAIWLVRTKLICHKARLIRFPIDIRGRKYIDFGENLTTGCCCRLEAFSQDGAKTMHFGKHIQMNDYVHISSMQNVTISDNVLLAGKIYISDNSHGSYKGCSSDSSPESIPIKREYYISPVIIEENVWIGEGVVILPGVVIGRGTIVGANSVVNKNIPPYSIAVGQPARVVKFYNLKQHRWEKI